MKEDLILELSTWKKQVLDTKSASFCGAKWYNSSMWFYNGLTASCHHNPGHSIDLEQIKLNPSALHNTPQKKVERQQMKTGERNLSCQFCWVIEDSDSDALSDRPLTSSLATDEQLQDAFDSDYDADFDLTYLEIGFDKTCNLACSYCGTSQSTTWMDDITENGAYTDITSDSRVQYALPNFSSHDVTPYMDAFINWWETSLYKTLKVLRITGGEPIMSRHTWRFLDWLATNPDKTSAECTFHMTTNLMYNKKILHRFLQVFEKINMPLEVWSSTETIGDKANYVRDGFVWDEWSANFDILINSNAVSKCGICTTPSAQNIDGFAEFLDWVLNVKLTSQTTIWVSVNPLRFPAFQSVLILPEDMRRKYRTDILAVVDKYTTGEHKNNLTFSSYELMQIMRFSDYLLMADTPFKVDFGNATTDTYDDTITEQRQTNTLQKDFKSFFTQYDARRGKNFVETFPQLAEWYNSL